MKKKSSKKSNRASGSIGEALGFSNIFQNEKINFILGFILAGLAIYLIIIFISFFNTGAADQSIIEHLHDGDIENKKNVIANSGHIFGAGASYFFISKCFGISAYLIPIFLILLSLRLMKVYSINVLKYFFILMVIMLWCSVAFAKFLTPLFPDLHFNLGGERGSDIMIYIENVVGSPGLIILLLITAIALLTYLSSQTIFIIRNLLHPKKLPKISMEIVDTNNTEEFDTEDTVMTFDNPSTESIEWNTEEGQHPEDIAGTYTREEANSDNEDIGEDIGIKIEVAPEEEKADSTKLVNNDRKELSPYDPKKDLSRYHYPTLDLLKKYDNDGQSFVDQNEQEQNKNRIIEVLRQFGVEISSIRATIGPTITLYEITPAPGIRISKIKNLGDDIALSLAAKGIRIIAPIPEKGTIGIEVPNAKPRIVSMESILNSKKFQESTMELPIALGKTITNEVFMVDLAKLPHLLVAGATGQGKSVGLNAIIASLLYKKHPAELKLVLVDPKKVEFSIYGTLYNHFLACTPDNEEEPIITDKDKVITTLNSLCKEMDDRYNLLKTAQARNIKEYNEKFKARKLNPLNGHRFMPYIVVIIDEFGDLILTAGREVEMPITRIAQLARAVGIHMVIATQRPTATIITGNIKANFPGRMAFKVSAAIDSRVILDRTGANQLVGRGDMLFLHDTEPIRVQCAFLDTPEVESINQYIAAQQGYPIPFELPEPEMASDESEDKGDLGPLDPLFEEAARMIIQSQQGSTSLIQRKFSIGYNRAGRLMDQMEKAGVVGPAQGSKPREVYITDENSLQQLMSKL